MPYPPKRTPEIEQEVLRRLSSGEPLAQICRDGHMPHMNTWREWCRADESLNIAHGRARDDGFDVIAADILVIADTQEMGQVITEKPDGTLERRTEDMLGHRKLRIETRLKLLAKWDPRRYGDRVTHAGDPDAPVELRTITRRIVDPGVITPSE